MTLAAILGRRRGDGGENEKDELAKGRFCEDQTETGAESKKAPGVSQGPFLIWSE